MRTDDELGEIYDRWAKHVTGSVEVIFWVPDECNVCEERVGSGFFVPITLGEEVKDITEVLIWALSYHCLWRAVSAEPDPQRELDHLCLVIATTRLINSTAPANDEGYEAVPLILPLCQALQCLQHIGVTGSYGHRYLVTSDLDR